MSLYNSLHCNHRHIQYSPSKHALIVIVLFFFHSLIQIVIFFYSLLFLMCVGVVFHIRLIFSRIGIVHMRINKVTKNYNIAILIPLQNFTLKSVFSGWRALEQIVAHMDLCFK